MHREIEAKYMSVDKDACRAKLAAAGYACVRPEFMMRRYTFMLTEVNPSPHKWARVRDEGDKVTMTFKHVHDSGDINGTEEVDFAVGSFDAAVLFMQKLGFNHWAYQESRRETWVKNGVDVTINEWPALPPFVEIEAASEQAVREASDALGFDYSRAVFGGVGALYGLQTAFSESDICRVRQLTFANAGNLAIEPVGGVA